MFFSWISFFGCLSSPPRVGYLEPYRVFFIQKFLANCDMPPCTRGCRPLGGVLSASSGDRLRCVSSSFDFSARSMEHGALCETWLSFSSRDKLGTTRISRFLRNIVCKVLCLCLPLGLPDGPNPRGYQARHGVTTPRRGTRRGPIFVASVASVATNNQALLRTT